MSIKSKKTILISLPIIFFLYYLFLLFTKGINDSYMFFFYNTSIVFSLPFLISKYISLEKRHYIQPAFFFLTYPAIYLLTLIISKIIPVDLSLLLYAVSILIIISWNFLLIFLINKINWTTISKFFKPHIYLIPAFLVYSIIFFMIRDLDTIVALDYLQHLSVAEKMRGGEMLCLIPNQCSELFLQVGYTTIYHTILGFLTAFSNENPLRAIFFIDLVYPLFIATLVFNLFRKFSKNIIIISIFSVITILTFINGSYETTFFIPQTLAFIIFLITINQKKLKPKDLFAIGILLFFIHFILGTYLLIFLILKYLLIDKASPKALGYFSKYIFFFALFTPIIFLIINSSGFSIESTFQKDAVESIGGYTNLMFPRNIWAYLTIWGGAGAFFFASIFLQHKKKQNWYLYSLIYLSLTLCVYLLAPTYANKFLIGTSIFSILLIIKYLENFKDIVINTLITIIILLSFLPNFYFKYSTYLNFYRQNDNIATAVPLRDKYMLKHTYYMETDCIFVSDPLTQIQIEGIGNKTTAKAQYIKPEARRKIYEFANNPSKENLTKVLNIEELEGREMCFVYSARLHTSIKRQDINWLFHTYSLAKDNSIPVQESIIKAFMLENHYKVDYQDPNFIVFKKD